MAGGSRQTHAATLPASRFYCLLDELPLHLIPQRFRGLLHACDKRNTDYRLNPNLVLTRDGEVPRDFASNPALLSGFAMNGTIAWVPDANKQWLQPFWLGPELDKLVSGMMAGGPPPSSLADRALSLLTAAGIVRSLLEEDRKNPAPETAATLFQHKGYAPLADLIHPFHIAALRRYYRYLIRTGAIHLGDGQSSRRYVAYNEPVARFFHHQICATLSKVAGQQLIPSYVYMASYLEGAELKKHTDRPQCEFSVTYCLDYSPEPSLESGWPIRLDTASGTVEVHQAIGDGLAYRGTRLPHYRDKLQEGKTSTSIFFHYVALDFTGPLA